jgi:hypothetical protein
MHLQIPYDVFIAYEEKSAVQTMVYCTCGVIFK